MPKNGLKKIFFLLAFPLLIISLVVVAFIYHKEIWSVFASPEALRAWIASLGFIAPLAFVGLQCIQVIIFIIPGEVPQIAGGYLFGLWWGSLLSVSGIIIVFLIFLIPGIPKDILCYGAGLTPLTLHVFLLISTLGRLPGILGSAFMGGAAAEEKWIVAGAVFLAASLLFLLGFFFKERILFLLEKLASRNKDYPGR
jgi:uncharacterized membrane protein YdjX (TVP38/TMEM64 family)